MSLLMIFQILLTFTYKILVKQMSNPNPIEHTAPTKFTSPKVEQKAHFKSAHEINCPVSRPTLLIIKNEQ